MEVPRLVGSIKQFTFHVQLAGHSGGERGGVGGSPRVATWLVVHETRAALEWPPLLPPSQLLLHPMSLACRTMWPWSLPAEPYTQPWKGSMGLSSSGGSGSIGKWCS